MVNEAQVGSLPRQRWVGSLWVSIETGAEPEEAPPTSLYAQGKKKSAVEWP